VSYAAWIAAAATAILMIIGYYKNRRSDTEPALAA